MPNTWNQSKKDFEETLGQNQQYLNMSEHDTLITFVNATSVAAR